MVTLLGFQKMDKVLVAHLEYELVSQSLASLLATLLGPQL
jgi:hypothetical protein